MSISSGTNALNPARANNRMPISSYLRSNKKVSRRRRRRRQINMPSNGNFQEQPSMSSYQQMFPGQSYMPSQDMSLNQQYFPSAQEQLNPALNPSYYQMPATPTSAIFQHGQVYATMDPQFFIQVQISSGSNGNGKESISKSIHH
jgi:hypothetical protein